MEGALKFMSPPLTITKSGRFVYYLCGICTPVDKGGGGQPQGSPSEG